MTKGHPFKDYLAEELQGDPALAAELGQAFDEVLLEVQIEMAREAAERKAKSAGSHRAGRSSRDSSL